MKRLSGFLLFAVGLDGTLRFSDLAASIAASEGFNGSPLRPHADRTRAAVNMTVIAMTGFDLIFDAISPRGPATAVDPDFHIMFCRQDHPWK